MNVVLYMRYSSDRQTEQSIEGQERVCREYCKRQGYTIVDKYIDRATSAYKDTDKRESFQQMIKDSDKQEWEAVIVYKLDRFARNRYDSAVYKSKLKKNGVRVISATENISDNPEGVILEAVLEGMAEFYSKELSQKINRGMRESALKCQSTGGKIALGYKLENKKLVIDEPRAEIVKEAFKLYANGNSIVEICEIFNSKGYRTSTGSQFNKNSFHLIFKNEKYIGVYKYKDIRIENGIPAIIDKETFECVQAKLRLNKKAPARSKAKEEYLLSTKLFCGHCNSTMIGESGTGRHGGVYQYYTCRNRKNGNECDKKPLRKDFIERAVVEDVINLIKPEAIEEIADMAIEALDKDLQNNTIIPNLRKQLEEINKSTNNLIKLAETGIVSSAISERLQELEVQRMQTEDALREAEAEIITLEKEQIVWWLSQFCNGNIDDPNFRKRVINLFVSSVTVWDEPDGTYKITSVYYLTSVKSKSRSVRFSTPNDHQTKKHPKGCFFVWWLKEQGLEAVKKLYGVEFLNGDRRIFRSITKDEDGNAPKHSRRVPDEIYKTSNILLNQLTVSLA